MRKDLLLAGVSLVGLCLAVIAPAAQAQQILLDGVPVAGSPAVTGQVQVPANGVLSLDPGTSIQHTGDAVVDAVDGITITVDNLGTITSTMSYGIEASGSSLLLANGGTIEGVRGGVRADTIVSLDNSGEISGQFVSGVEADTLADATNSGTITALLNGIQATDIGTLVNSGTIHGMRTTGVLANDTIESLVNSGTISSGGSGVSATTLTSLVNSGTIRGGMLLGHAGVKMDRGSVSNSGLIEGQRGILVTHPMAGNATVTNSGTIRSLLGAAGTALDFQGTGEDTLTVLGDFTIEGAIVWDGAGDRFNHAGGRSAALTFSSLPAQIDTGGRPFVISGTRVDVADPTALALADAMLADTTGAISDVLAGRFGTGGSGAAAVAMGDGTSVTVVPAAGTRGHARAWAEAFGGWRGRDAAGPTLGSTHLYGGMAAGVDAMAGDATRVGLFIGGSQGRTDVDFDALDIETESVFAGLYASHDAGPVRIDAAITAGLADHDTTRVVANNLVPGGVETARGSYDGVFVSPEVTVSPAMTAGALDMRPSLRLRYAGLWLDDYAESGSSSALSVDDRSVHVLEARAQLAIPMTVVDSEHGTAVTELRVGIDGRTSLGSGKVDAVLAGRDVRFDPGGRDDVATAFAAAAFALKAVNRVTVTGSVEAGYGTDAAARVTARMGARIAF